MIFRSFMLGSMRLNFIAVTGICVVVIVSWSLATTACEVLLGRKLPILMRYDNPLMNRALKGSVST
jgi:hypothetical protein